MFYASDSNPCTTCCIQILEMTSHRFWNPNPCRIWQFMLALVEPTDGKKSSYLTFLVYPTIHNTCENQIVSIRNAPCIISPKLKCYVSIKNTKINNIKTKSSKRRKAPQLTKIFIFTYKIFIQTRKLYYGGQLTQVVEPQVSVVEFRIWVMVAEMSLKYELW